jgi:hypothetical protein
MKINKHNLKSSEVVVGAFNINTIRRCFYDGYYLTNTTKMVWFSVQDYLGGGRLFYGSTCLLQWSRDYNVLHINMSAYNRDIKRIQNLIEKQVMNLSNDITVYGEYGLASGVNMLINNNDKFKLENYIQIER